MMPSEESHTGIEQALNDDDGVEIDERTASEIGKLLRQSYSDVLEGPVPKRFRDLIKNLADDREK